jgi:hypothetical protein
LVYFACADDPALRHAIHLPLMVGHPLCVIFDGFSRFLPPVHIRFSPNADPSLADKRGAVEAGQTI